MNAERIPTGMERGPATVTPEMMESPEVKQALEKFKKQFGVDIKNAAEL